MTTQRELQSRWWEESGRLRWELRGRLDALSAGGARAELADAVLPGRGAVVLDLTGLDFLDSAGLAVLVQVLRRGQADGVPVRMAMPVAADAARVLDLTQFDQVFDRALPGDVPGDLSDDLSEGGGA